MTLEDKTVELTLNGDIDAAVTPEIQHNIDMLLNDGARIFKLDMSGVTYIDSSGIGTLIYLDRKLKPLDGSFSLVGANEYVLHVLSLAGLIDTMSSMCISQEITVRDSDAEDSEEQPRFEDVHVFTCDLAQMGEIREMVIDEISGLAFTDHETYDIKLAFGEALSNAFQYGCSEDDDTVKVRVAIYEQRIELEITDSGNGFTMESDELPDVFETRGRGIRLMHMLMDEVEFKLAPEGGMRVKMIKMLPGEAEESPSA